MQKFYQKFFFSIITLFSFSILFILVGIIGKILINGLPVLSLDFLLQEPANMGKEGGIFSTIITTLLLTMISLGIAAPIGIMAAIYLAEYAKKGRILNLIRFGTEALAGVPSIIFGLFGYAFFVMFLGFRYSILSGALTLTFMIIPTIIRTSEEAILSVPNSYREGSLVLGATKWYTIRKIVLPSAKSGILAGIILGIGRVVGETAAVIFTAGSSLGIPESIWRPGRTMSVHLYILASEGLSQENMYGTAAVLIITVAIINLIANKVMGKQVQKA